MKEFGACSGCAAANQLLALFLPLALSPGVPRQGGLDPHVHHEHRRQRLLQQRPHDRRRACLLCECSIHVFLFMLFMWAAAGSVTGCSYPAALTISAALTFSSLQYNREIWGSSECRVPIVDE